MFDATENTKKENPFSSLSDQELEQKISEYLDDLDCDLNTLDQMLDEYDTRPSALEVDMEHSWKELQHRAALQASSIKKGRSKKKHLMVRKAMTAAAIFVAVFGCSLGVTQAAGVDVIGAIAQWTEDVLGYGNTIGVTLVDSYDTESITASDSVSEQSSSNALDFASLQEALDAYEITEVVAPDETLKGYTLTRLTVTENDETMLLQIYADFQSSSDSFSVQISYYDETPNTEYQKTEEDPLLLTVNGIMLYVFNNINNKIATWTTSHYECAVFSTMEMEEEALIQIASSMIPESA